jgi:hypothetical protein
MVKSDQFVSAKNHIPVKHYRRFYLEHTALLCTSMRL